MHELYKLVMYVVSCYHNLLINVDGRNSSDDRGATINAGAYSIIDFDG